MAPTGRTPGKAAVKKAVGSAISTTTFKVFWSALPADSECAFLKIQKKTGRVL